MHACVHTHHKRGWVYTYSKPLCSFEMCKQKLIVMFSDVQQKSFTFRQKVKEECMYISPTKDPCMITHRVSTAMYGSIYG